MWTVLKRNGKKIVSLCFVVACTCVAFVVLLKLDFFTGVPREKIVDKVVVTPLSNKVLDKFDFAKQGKKPKRTIPLVFVDEHHEVVPYWAREIVNGRLSAKGNVLVHVDGHSDLAIPDDLEGILNSKLSKDTKVGDLRAFMGSNDRFITPFLLTGMYDSLLWVFPKFSEPLNTTFYNQVKGFGFVTKGTAGRPCLCDATRKSPKTRCIQVTQSINDENKLLFIPAKDCRIIRNLRLKFINEEDLESFLKTGWIQKGKQIVLDIDEDFYGVATDYARALTYFSNSDLNRISEILNDIFCPASTHDERLLDSILRGVLSDVISFKGSHSNFDEGGVKKTAQDIVENKMLKRGLKCRKPKDKTGTDVIYLARLLHTFTVQQIEMLKRFHFCLRHSPLLGNSKFGVCLGMPVFNQVTHAFNPDTDVIRHKTKIIRKLFRTLFKTNPGPQIVTVCRSIRDSYTSRPKFREIENSLLLALKESSFKEKVSLVEEYDENLLFGKRGWIDA